MLLGIRRIRETYSFAPATSYLAVRAIRRQDETEIYERYAHQIVNELGPQKLIEAKDRAHMLTAFDLRDLGKSLSAIEFVDF
jgi:hypothetical protein